MADFVAFSALNTHLSASHGKAEAPAGATCSSPKGMPPPFGAKAFQGRHERMEDHHVCVPEFYSLGPVAEGSASEQLSYFGIFDGHGGTKVKGLGLEWTPVIH